MFLCSVVLAEFPDGYKQVWVYVGNRTKGDPNYKAHGMYHSQYEQDEHVLKIMRYKTEGTFLDLAANQPVHISNSFAMERDYGWDGWCIDANYYVWQGLATRKCTVIAAAVGRVMNEEIPFKYRNAGGEAAYGGLIKEGMKQAKRTPNEGTVFTVTLNNIFEEFDLPQTIDYASIDIEGAELYALSSFDWDKYRFNVITIEGHDEDIRLMLMHNGYWYVTHLGEDNLWVHSDFMDRDEARDLIDDLIH